MRERLEDRQHTRRVQIQIEHITLLTHRYHVTRGLIRKWRKRIRATRRRGARLPIKAGYQCAQVLLKNWNTNQK